MLASDIINASLKKIGVLAKGETASTNDSNDALNYLNYMLATWSARELLNLAQIQESFTLIANQQSYTIGVGANFNTAKPFNIKSAFVRDTSNYDTPVFPMTREEYFGIEDKLLSVARPTDLFYDKGSTHQTTDTGTIYLYPIPDASTTYTLFIESEKAWTDLGTLSTTVNFEEMYTEALIYNLAIRLAPDYGKPVSAEVIAIAKETLGILETSNFRPIVMTTDLPGIKGKAFNIYTDQG